MLGARCSPISTTFATRPSNMLKDTQTAPDYAGIPTAVFTVPEVARVGMLESEARDAGYDVDVRFTDTGDWYSNYRIGETSAAAKGRCKLNSLAPRKWPVLERQMLAAPFQASKASIR